ncbi:VanZ family protein [Erysipelothrix sp. HDW6C]|uniref:VanZ family protein n=1 Tax=Erysipelothrix sp. HDW6C TaxID=2714930 RepID=UPI001407839F|nr:VanZ family protein [Erysipelothrix sp. HDW6C]QIK69751.1 VanZ family protein [Erysipelothrix sp. HDW6C]
MLTRHSGPGWMATGFLFYIPIYALFYGFYLKKQTKKAKISWTLLFVYTFLVFDLTQFPYPIGESAREHVATQHSFRYNLVPLDNFIENFFISFRPRYLFENFMNVMIFIPFGFLVANVLKGNKRFVKVLLISFGFTLMIELLQLVTSMTGMNVRIFDVDDLIFNTIGGVIGYLCFAIIRSIQAKRKHS